jgi:hypothetical protein
MENEVLVHFGWIIKDLNAEGPGFSLKECQNYKKRIIFVDISDCKANNSSAVLK